LNSEYIIRKYWFGSYQGDDHFFRSLREKLRECNFEPVMIKKRQGKEKGVDISLTKEMLVNAFNNNFDVAFLIAGDEDYLTIVNEIKRYGAKIYGAFFSHGLSDELKISLGTVSNHLKYFKEHGLISVSGHERTLTTLGRLVKEILELKEAIG